MELDRRNVPVDVEELVSAIGPIGAGEPVCAVGPVISDRLAKARGPVCAVGIAGTAGELDSVEEPVGGRLTACSMERPAA